MLRKTRELLLIREIINLFKKYVSLMADPLLLATMIAYTCSYQYKPRVHMKVV